jgi:hypothetical protein
VFDDGLMPAAPRSTRGGSPRQPTCRAAGCRPPATGDWAIGDVDVIRTPNVWRTTGCLGGDLSEVSALTRFSPATRTAFVAVERLFWAIPSHRLWAISLSMSASTCQGIDTPL